MFEHQVPQLAAGSVGSGNTTVTIELLAATVGVKHRLWLDYLALGAAGHLTVQSNTAALTNKFPFSAKGTSYVGVLLEGVVGDALNVAAVLDAAAPGAGVPVEALFRHDAI
jgi:hypothetical protein